MSEFIVLDMPGTYALKPHFQSILRPAVAQLAASGIRANHITIFACALSIAFGTMLLTSPDPRLFQILPLVIFIRMALNAMDGMLAREFNQATPLGMYLNELGDVVSDVFLILPFAHLRGFSPFWIWNVVVMSVIAEMAGILAVMAGASRRYDGPMGKSDRALVAGAAGFVGGNRRRSPPAGRVSPSQDSSGLASCDCRRARAPRATGTLANEPGCTKPGG